MNKYVKAGIYVTCGIIKMTMTKLFHIKSFNGPIISFASPLSEITLENGGVLRIGKKFKLRDEAKIRVRKGACCIIGNNVFVNSNSMITCHDYIIIGNDVQLSPNVQIYDHDHDFRVKGGIKAGKFKTSSVKIGNNVWIGANTVVLRGTELGDGCVVAAGSILKGKYGSNQLIVQKRNECIINCTKASCIERNY